jgi:hypothetical protein
MYKYVSKPLYYLLKYKNGTANSKKQNSRVILN